MQINHLNDILPAIDDRKDFVVAVKDDYIVVDYRFADKDTFDDPIRRELRGIKFKSNGDILARPFHKFFNVGEREETRLETIDWSKPHTIIEKMDGSMIHPAMINGQVVFMTRMGITDVAEQASKLLSAKYRIFCSMLLNRGWTPIFEFTAPDNRIVIRYDEPRLTLLAIRNTQSGRYLPRKQVGVWARNHSIPLVYEVGYSVENPKTWLKAVRAIKEMEGFVVHFEDGLTVKAKGDDYVLKHKTKDQINQEKNVLALILNGEADDLKSLLDPGDADALVMFEEAVWTSIMDNAKLVSDFLIHTGDVDRKTFATDHVTKLPMSLRPVAFKALDGQDPMPVIMKILTKATTSGTKVEESRSLLCGHRWNSFISP